MYPILDKHHVQLSLECPLHPNREQLWWPELIEPADGDGSLQQYFQQYFSRLLELRLWRCPFCEQHFFSAERLMVHWDDQHRIDWPTREDSICLADYCELFHCDARLQTIDSESPTHHHSSQTVSVCDQAHLRKLQAQCELLAHRCSISPSALDSLQRVQTVQQELFDALCSNLTCEHLRTSRLESVSSRFVLISNVFFRRPFVAFFWLLTSGDLMRRVESISLRSLCG